MQRYEALAALTRPRPVRSPPRSATFRIAVLALVFLVFRPQGLFGEKIIERV